MIRTFRLEKARTISVTSATPRTDTDTIPAPLGSSLMPTEILLSGRACAHLGSTTFVLAKLSIAAGARHLHKEPQGTGNRTLTPRTTRNEPRAFRHTAPLVQWLCGWLNSHIPRILVLRHPNTICWWQKTLKSLAKRHQLGLHGR